MPSTEVYPVGKGRTSRGVASVLVAEVKYSFPVLSVLMALVYLMLSPLPLAFGSVLLDDLITTATPDVCDCAPFQVKLLVLMLPNSTFC